MSQRTFSHSSTDYKSAFRKNLCIERNVTVSAVFNPILNIAGLSRNRIQRYLNNSITGHNSPQITAKYKRSSGISTSPWRKEVCLFFSSPWLESSFHSAAGRETINSAGAVSEADWVEFSQQRHTFEFLRARARADGTLLPRGAARIRWIRHIKHFPSTVSTQNDVLSLLSLYFSRFIWYQSTVQSLFITFTYIRPFQWAIINLSQHKTV